MDRFIHEFDDGLVHLAARRWEAAVACLRLAARREPGRVAVIKALASACLQMGDWQGAREAARGLILSSPMCAEGWRLAAQLEWKLGKYDDAMAVLARGLEHLPRSAVLQRQKAMFWGARGKIEKRPETRPASGPAKREDWLDRVAEDSKLLESVLNSPQNEHDIPMLKQLELRVAALLESQPYHADRQFALARLQVRIGAMSAALVSVGRAVHANPSYIEAHRLRATILSRMGDTDAAIEALQDLIRSGANWPDLHVQLAGLQNAQGQAQEARSHLYSAICLNPKFEQAKAMLEKMAA